MQSIRNAATVLLGLALAGSAWSQATVKTDGQWRAALGAGASVSDGNAKSTQIQLTGEAVRATEQDKMSAYANMLYARASGATTADQQRLGGRYDYNLNPQLFGFGGLDIERNAPANLALRGTVSGGLGLHAIKGETTTVDVFGGLAYTTDRYREFTVVDDATRKSYSYLALMLGEESTHRLSDTTSAKQKLVLIPNLSNRGAVRATWDAGVAVAMSKTMNLTAGLGVQYNSDPGTGRKKTDTLLTTGVSVKFD